MFNFFSEISSCIGRQRGPLLAGTHAHCGSVNAPLHPPADPHLTRSCSFAGEDPLYVVRRLIVMASEDIGLADNQALPLVRPPSKPCPVLHHPLIRRYAPLHQAIATLHACQQVGMPECRINLAHCVAYLAEAPKSTRAYKAYNQVRLQTPRTKPALALTSALCSRSGCRCLRRQAVVPCALEHAQLGYAPGPTTRAWPRVQLRSDLLTSGP